MGAKRPGVLRRFGASRRANAAVVFAFSLLPIALAAGAAVDLRRAQSTKAELQDAVDAAVLAASRAYYSNGAKTASQRESAAKSVADAYMEQSVGRRARSMLDPQWTLTHDASEGEFTLSASAKSVAAFGGLFGVRTLDVRVGSAAAAGDMKLEIALVLDSTGSMAGSKMTNLKKAAKNFVDTLESAAASHPKPDAVKIALVPYNHAVKVDPSYASAVWMDGEGQSSIHYENLSVVTAGEALPPSKRMQKGVNLPTRFQLFTMLGKPWKGCLEARPGVYETSEKIPDRGDPDSLYVPMFYPDEPDWTAPVSGDRPNTYIPDGPLPADADKDWWKRQQNIAKYYGKPTVVGEGPNFGCGITPVVRLTNRFDTIRSGINNLKADGFTNITNGLHWGWNVVSDAAPFSDGAAYSDKDTRKIIVLMTDGLNTYNEKYSQNQSDYAAYGFLGKGRIGIKSGNGNQRAAAMDARLKQLCTSVKNKGVEVYTIRVEVTDGDTSLLKGCASDPEHFKEVRNSAELDKVFSDIAKSILALRLSR